LVDEGKKTKLITWGNNDDGVLGRETKDDEEAQTPTKVPLSHHFVQVSTGDYHMLALTNTGKLYLWGGYRDNQNYIEPKEGPHLVKKYLDERKGITTENTKIISIASGSNFSVVLTEEGTVYQWGCTR